MPSQKGHKKISFAPLDIALGTAWALAINAVLFGDRYLANGRTFLAATLCTSVVGILLSHAHNVLASRLSKRLEERRTSGGRVLLSHLLFFPLTALVTLAVFYGYHWLQFPGYVLDAANLKWVLLIGFVAELLGIGFGQSLRSMSVLQQTELDRERLQKLQLQNELEILKNQVNPHFLFNCLNVLSSLIGEDAQKAESFVDQLSKVYSYLLRNNRQAWTSLGDELKFIEAYAFLLHTRYGDGIKLSLNIDEDCLDAQLPPLTLQLLVENAVKHNVVHRSQPLTISIGACGQTLTVENNVQKKARQQVVSHGIGLKNISEKYRLLQGKSITVEEKGEIFCVSLPLVEPSLVRV